MPDSRNFGGANPGEPVLKSGGKNYLLAIGIDQYEHVGKLKNCVGDARAFVEVLEAHYGFSRKNIKELYNEDASQENIIEELEQLSETLGEKDNLIVYFAGHGIYKKRTQMGYLVPVGGKREKVASLIFNGRIRGYINGIQAHHIFLVVDSCFSGDLILRSRGEGNPIGAIESYAQKVASKPSRWGLAAGRIEEVADGIAGNHSPFNKTLVTFLKTHSSAQFAVSELINHVCKITTYNADQTPIGGILDKAGHQGGEFVFRRKLDEKELWEEVRRGNTLEGYRQYLAQFPHGNFTEEGHWEVARLLESSASFMQYLEAFPKGKYVSEALDKLKGIEEKNLWEETLKKNTYTAYVEFLQKYPKGIYTERAWQKRREFGQAQARKEAWQKAQRADNLAEYRSFIERFGGSNEAKDAQARIEALESEIAYKAKQEERKRREAEMKRAWEEAHKENSQVGYERFLSQFPGSVYERSARIQLKKLKKKQKPPSDPTSTRKTLDKDPQVQKKRALIVLAIIVLSGSIGLVSLLRNLKISPPSIPSYPKMVPIPGGTFIMGSKDGEDDENPPHEVTLSSFELAETEVTFEQYDYFCEQTHREKPNDEGWGRGTRPVINVSWEDAEAYCDWLSQKTGHGYRLPTEAEWEFATRGGNSEKDKNYRYAGSNDPDAVAWHTGNSSSKTHPVGQKQPNGLSLYDMSGNVWEWCADWYASDYYASSPSTNPQGPPSGSVRVFRGGSWVNDASSLRVAFRVRWFPDSRSSGVGFRPARTP